jgi:NAD(P)H-hydrate epimerase
LALARILPDYNAGRVRVVLAADPAEYSGDAKANLDRLGEANIFPERQVPKKLRDRREVTLVIDALLGTGARGAPAGGVAELIRAVKEFPEAKIVAVDLPSGLGCGGEVVRADVTVTFTSPKVEHFLAAETECVGQLVVAGIGIPPQLIPGGLETTDRADIAPLFAPRKRDAHKGDFGHVLVVGGAPGKTGAAAMAALAALRMGAGLVTVTADGAAAIAPELMTEPLGGFTLEGKTVVAVGPGLGSHWKAVAQVEQSGLAGVVDADGLNMIAELMAQGKQFRGQGVGTILTPHPGEMARLLGRPVGDRLSDARAFATERNVCLVLKGHRTLVAAPDGTVWINTTGSPAMAKGGSGDILTGLIAGLIAQYPYDILRAVRAAVWLHGRAGEMAAAELTEFCVLATDLLRFLPAAILDLQRS